MIEKPLNYLVDSLLPEYIKEEYPKYVSFITAYLQMQEEETGPFKVLNDIINFIDISKTPEETLSDFVYQYLSSFPVEFLGDVNIREFVTNSKNFYSYKGGESSVRFIFNLTGGSLDFFYPSDYIFELNSSTLSGSHKIHDNFFYAYYVYEVITDLDASVYETILRSMTHPIGEKLFFKKLVYATAEGVIFDAQVTSNTVRYIEESVVGTNNITGEQNLIYENILKGYPSTYSSIIEDNFFVITAKNIEDYFGLTVQKLTQDPGIPVDIFYTISNTNISFDTVDDSINTSVGTDFSVFETGTEITISGSPGNSSTFTITGIVSPTQIFVIGNLATESIGALISLTNE